MNHSVELSVDKFNGEEYAENELEVTFDITYGAYEITGYFLNGNAVDYEDLLEDNPRLTKQIDKAIDHYVVNYEEEPIFDDCE